MACSYCREFMRMKNADLMQKSGDLRGNMLVLHIASEEKVCTCKKNGMSVYQ